MDEFSFHGPFAYRWIDDVPVERIDLRSGERHPIEVVSTGLPPTACGQEPATETGVRAAMAAWN